MSELVHRPTADDGAATPEPTVPARERALAAYLVLSLLLLVPGFVAATSLRQLFDEASPPGRWLAALDGELQRIAFGTTPRFWMGVAGATAMALLLLYPLRKMFGFLRWISVGSWFHLHVVLGLAGPVLIAYHCYFGTGSTPANVALFTTIAVAVSGIFGHYIYARISADVHGRRQSAVSALDAARNELGALTATTARDRLFDDLATYEQSAKAEAHGILGRLRLARNQRSMRHDLLQRAGDLIRVEAETRRWEPDRTRQTIRRVQQQLAATFGGLGVASRRAVWERLAARWRLLHLPLFYVTVIAASIHVYKVWDMDGPTAAVTQEADAGTTAEPRDAAASDTRGGATLSAGNTAGPTATAAQAPASPIIPRHVVTHAETLTKKAETRPPALAKPKLLIAPTMLREGETSPVAAAAPAAPDTPATPATPQGRVAHAGGQPPTPPDKPPLLNDPRAVASSADAPERKAVTPAPIASPPHPPVVRSPPSKPIVAALPKPVTPEMRAPDRAPPPVPPPARVAAAPVEPLPPPPMAAGARDADPVTQLEKRTAQLDNTGRLDPATMRERLRLLKADRTFNHDKTRFPLTGKHRRVDCESCHKTTLKDTSHRCISCHKKDDVHRGRRPNCESCHVTTNWGTIRRR